MMLVMPVVFTFMFLACLGPRTRRTLWRAPIAQQLYMGGSTPANRPRAMKKA
jgi:hypothetical protein